MTTDITELAQSLKRRATSANEFGESLYVKADDVLALAEALEKSEKTSEARREAIDRTHNMFVRERDRANAAEEALEKAQTINAAAEKLVRCKGRYHSEQNYRALAALLGVTTPDLPPLDSESRTVTMKQYDEFQICHYGATEDYAKGYIDCQNNFSKWLTAAGIKWEAE